MWTMFTRAARKGYPDETLLSVYREHGVVPKDSRADNFNRASDDLSAYQLVEPGDLAVNKMKAWQGSLSISQYRGIVSPAYFIYTPHHHHDRRYLHHLLRSQPMVAAYKAVSAGVRIGQWDLDPFAFSRLKLAMPSAPEQRAIADYLDRETAQIDTLIAKQEQLIVTLRERRNAVSEVLLADRIRNGDRLKWSVNEIDHRAGTRWSELPLLSVSITWGVRRRDEMTDDVPRAEDLSMYKLVDRGAVVINRMRAFQGALGVAGEAGIVSPDYAVLQPGSAIDAHWLAALMRTQTFVAEMSSRLKGIGGTEGGAVRTPRINVDDLLDIVVDLPSLSHQEDDLRSMTLQTAKIDTLISKAEQFIALSKERRSALITAAVTGQIDVTGKAA